MLAARIIATLLIRDSQLVKGKNFINDRKIGSILQTVNIMQKREIDEMVILDVDASKNGGLIDYNLVQDLTADCFMPLGFGGGIRTINDIGSLLEKGADKVIIGTAWNDYKLIENAAKMFGSQAICIAYNYYELHDLSAIKRIEDSGAGEIILNSITRDGTMQGFDLDAINKVKCGIPVIACGGAGCYEHFYKAIKAGANAVAAGAMWAFTEYTPIGAKKYLKEKGIPVRL